MYIHIHTHSNFLYFLSLWSKYFKTPSTINNVQYTDNYITNKHTYKSHVTLYKHKYCYSLKRKTLHSYSYNTDNVYVF